MYPRMLILCHQLLHDFWQATERKPNACHTPKGYGTVCHLKQIIQFLVCDQALKAGDFSSQ